MASPSSPSTAILPSPMRESVIGLAEGQNDGERLAAAGRYFRSRRGNYGDLLRQLLRQGGLALRCLTVYHIGELGMAELREDLEGLRDDPSPFLGEVIERALELLAAPAEEEHA